MKLIHLAAAAAIATSVSTTFTACGEERADDALTIEDGNDERKKGAGERDAPGIEVNGAGRLLTQAEIEAALPTVQDMPTGWTRDKENEEDDDSEDDEKVTPVRCEEIMGEAEDDEDAVAEATRAFKADDFGPFLTVEVSSYDAEVPDDALDEVADALSKCKKFTMVDAEGSKTKVVAESLSFPNLGDETFAVRMKMDTEFLPAALDLVMVRVGHTR